MKGQYFSFDAIVAAVIMVLAFSTLLAYWYGVQSVIESRTGNFYYSSIRIADSLLSPGSPSDWPVLPIDQRKQIGLANGFGNELNKSKVVELQNWATSDQWQVKNMLHIDAYSNFYIQITQTDGIAPNYNYNIGVAPPANATEVVRAHRGAVMNGHPVHITVTLWR